MSAKYSKQIEALYFEMYGQMIVYAQSALGSRPLAEEAVQETFRIACQKARNVCTSPNPQGWIFNTLKYTIQNMRRNQESAKQLLDRYALQQKGKTPATENSISLDALYENLADSEEFQILKELAVERKSHEEIAAARGISVSASKKRVQRAKALLRKKMKNYI